MKKSKKKVVITWIWILAILAVVIGLTFNIIELFEKNVQVSDELKSTLTERPELFPDNNIDTTRLGTTLGCPSIDYAVCVPMEVSTDSKCLIGEYEGLDFVVMESTEDTQGMLENVLPQKINISLFGYENEVQLLEEGKGYFYQYPAEYFVSKTKTKISVREVTTYSVMYRLMLEGEVSLYMYVSTEDSGQLENAKILLDAMAYSVRKVDAAEEEELQDYSDGTVEGMLTEEEYESFDYYEGENAYNIKLEHELNTAIEDGVFVFEWMNVEAHPAEVIVYDPDGKQLRKMDEYSTEGHYAYAVDNASAGTYKVEGHTIEQITGVIMSVYEKEDYLIFMGYEEREDYSYTKMR